MTTGPHWLITTAMREPDTEKAQACADAFKPLGELVNSKPATSPADYAAQIVQLRIQLADYSKEIAFLRNQLAAIAPLKCDKCGAAYEGGRPGCECDQLQGI